MCIKLQEIFIFLTSHRIPPIAILCIFIEAIQQVRHLGKEQSQKATKNGIERRACSHQSDTPHTDSSMFFSVAQSLFLPGFS